MAFISNLEVVVIAYSSVFH